MSLAVGESSQHLAIKAVGLAREDELILQNSWDRLIETFQLTQGFETKNSWVPSVPQSSFIPSILIVFHGLLPNPTSFGLQNGCLYSVFPIIVAMSVSYSC